jgi:hypothetical protein
MDILMHGRGCQVVMLWRPHKRQGGHVVWNQGFAGELADGGQD